MAPSRLHNGYDGGGTRPKMSLIGSDGGGTSPKYTKFVRDNGGGGTDHGPEDGKKRPRSAGWMDRSAGWSRTDTKDRFHFLR